MESFRSFRAVCPALKRNMGNGVGETPYRAIYPPLTIPAVLAILAFLLPILTTPYVSAYTTTNYDLEFNTTSELATSSGLRINETEGVLRLNSTNTTASLNNYTVFLNSTLSNLNANLVIGKLLIDGPLGSTSNPWNRNATPLLQPYVDGFDVLIPCVTQDGSTYRMYYTAYDGGRYTICLATSSDGVSWNKVYPQPVLDFNTDTYSADRSHVGWPCVIKDGSTYKMWYRAYGIVYQGDGWRTAWRVMYTTSSDGVNWGSR